MEIHFFYGDLFYVFSLKSSGVHRENSADEINLRLSGHVWRLRCYVLRQKVAFKL